MSPLRVALFYDYPQADGGAFFHAGVELGLATVELDDAIELHDVQANGLPGGTAEELVAAFEAMAGDDDVLAIIGPSITDNTMLVRDLADERQVPCINYTGGERTRSEWMFHYQVGSLEEEPSVVVDHLVDRQLTSAAVLYDRSEVGHRYAEYYAAAALRGGIETRSAEEISAVADDLTDVVGRARETEPHALVYFGLGVASRAVALAVGELEWDVPVVANSSLMFGYLRPDWREGFEGWVYVDTISDANPVRAALREVSAKHASGPMGCAAFDIGRLLGEGVARAPELTRQGLRHGLERVKRLPAASGEPGTTMGFGVWDRAALKGPSLVLRTWRAGRSTELG